MTGLKCRCGYYHYNFQHWSKIHGESKKYIDPLVRVAFVGDKIWNESEYDPTQPYPLITRKWICQFCGQGQGHDSNCSFFLNYPEFFRTNKPKFPYIPPQSKLQKPTLSKKTKDENTKRTLTGWNKVGKITFRQWKKLLNVVDPQQEFTLTDLLGLLNSLPFPPSQFTTPISSTPTTPDSSRSPTPDHFEKEKVRKYRELNQLFDKYLETYPFFTPDERINDLGVQKNKWNVNDSWIDYLLTSEDEEELENKKQEILNIFGWVMITHYLEKKDLNSIDEFQSECPTLWPQELEQEVKQLRKKTEIKELEPWIKKEGGFMGFGGKDKDYSNISLEFKNKPELINKWNEQGFCYEEVADWIRIGLEVSDADYASWLINKHNIDSDNLLDNSNSLEIRKIFDDLTIAYRKLRHEIPWENQENEQTIKNQINKLNGTVEYFSLIDKIDKGKITI